MTAVAPPPNFQNISRQGWSGGSTNGVANGTTPMTEDYRMFMPRKSIQRANSSSSLSSNASSTSTISTSSSQTNGVGSTPAGEGSTLAARKKAPRGLWPPSKTEPISGISTAGPQSIASAGPRPSAASAMTALQSPSAMLPSQHNGNVQGPQNGAQRPQSQEGGTAILHLIPMNGTFERKTITVPFFPDVLRIGRQTNNKTIPTPLNGFFDSKVLSRSHAEIWADRNGKIWIRDVKSSNGTFVNAQRLSQENRDSDPHELREQDMLELGIDIVSEDQKTIVHHKVAARVEHAGIYSNNGGNIMDMNFGELENQQMNLMGAGGQQPMGNPRGRTPSQGSINGNRMQGPGAAMGNSVGMQPPRHPSFWLQPITMEQVVKKLNAEIKVARQQSQELQQTHHYIHSILSADPKKDQSKPTTNNHIKVSPIKDIKARFSEPPAPPPQQPLPEKPDAHQPSLRRSDTERPKLNGSPVRSDAQITTLAEALSSAKKELESQSAQLKTLEALLTEERRAREDAEERAKRFERDASRDSELSGPTLVNGDDEASQNAPKENLNESPSDEDAAPAHADTASDRLQQRLDSMMSEMNDMKLQIETYRLRAETAEAESATHRKTLAEMIEKIRADDAKNASNASKRRNQAELDSARSISSDDAGQNGEEYSEQGEIMIMNEPEREAEDTESALRKIVAQNGHTVSPADAAALSKATQELVTRSQNRSDTALSHGAPAMSILTVVALGVAVMAWLNSVPKVER
ncbi:hypothetical protein BU24DRAFT_42247 [Aaosphaeria arxii CBS 175.79]|uniref:FHA domain-containing protein n=1 Tax=Aaosphaeria arxii CBS 175.79 TaxID=1450172 RepID=A0A6A5YAQ3_9PLEO|nr:uncharacterized protein BU24DRAFT_42247 [Aaosphaeria arxii CBS 175.79]KAF2022303.1 hypothetical protein BU24DRAFT_42247 [Aaosphaeria arxii CBS 175.79]